MEMDAVNSIQQQSKVGARTSVAPGKPKEKTILQPKAGTTEAPAKSEEIKKTIARITEELQSMRQVDMVYDEATNRVIVRVVNANTHELVRQIPPEQVLKFSNNFEELLGLLVNSKV
jgi:flagellar protein FlaG